jgi:hypothetical protein
MTKLISKLQYRQYEKGEFDAIAARTLEEVISVLRSFPWDSERHLTSVELTCPSVTLEHPVGTFLKVGPYFSGKFALYFLDTNNKVYVKTLSTLEDVCDWVKNYYEQGGKLDKFDKYGFVFNPIAHFQTNTFEYIVDSRAVRAFFKYGIWTMALAVLVCVLQNLGRHQGLNLTIAFIPVFLILVLSSPLIYLYFNYRAVDGSHYLQLSKGHKEFVFGTIGRTKLYNKKDIAEIRIKSVNNNRTLLSGCSVFTITFNDGEQLRFTSLLIAESRFRNKFPGQQIISVRKNFPRIK